MEIVKNILEKGDVVICTMKKIKKRILTSLM